MSGQSIFDDVADKFLAALAGVKLMAAQDSIELLANHFFRNTGRAVSVWTFFMGRPRSRRLGHPEYPLYEPVSIVPLKALKTNTFGE